MNLQVIPSHTIDLIKWIEEIYPDVFELDENIVGTPLYYKKAGVVELVQKLKYLAGRDTLLSKE